MCRGVGGERGFDSSAACYLPPLPPRGFDGANGSRGPGPPAGARDGLVPTQGDISSPLRAHSAPPTV
jgi:hypothetical protein